jgi:4'-phosphopantetheinyl transferase
MGGERCFADPARVLELTTAPALVGLEVHAWAVELGADTATLRRCQALLTQQERAQSLRFVFDADRCAYAVAHAILRHLLQLYGADSSREFECSEGGKPHLAPSARSTLHFNLSHSHGRALIGFCRDRHLGVDVEMERPIEVFEIADSYFFGPEIAAIRAAAAPRAEFFRYWVCKEAVLKGDGVGLGLELDQFVVQLEPAGSTATVQSRDLDRLAPDWRVRVLELEPGWPGAVAMRGIAPDVRVLP